MSISEPRADLNSMQVSNAAMGIIDARLHDESIGQLTKLHRADIVSTDTIVLF